MRGSSAWLLLQRASRACRVNAVQYAAGRDVAVEQVAAASCHTASYSLVQRQAATCTPDLQGWRCSERAMPTGGALLRLAQQQLRPFTNSSSSTAAADGEGGDEESAAGINPLQQVPMRTDADGPVGAAGRQGSYVAHEARALMRNAKISPKKLTMFAQMLRRSHVDDALIQCQISPKKSAQLCYGVLRSAIANAKYKGMDEGRLVVAEAYATKGRYLKRHMYHGRGRTGIMERARSHLTIKLEEGDTPRRTRVMPPYLQRLQKRAARKQQHYERASIAGAASTSAQGSAGA